MIKLEWVVFVALKIIELATIIFLPYFVGKRILDEDEENKLLLWAMGVAGILGVVGGIILIYLVGFLLIHGNLKIISLLGF